MKKQRKNQLIIIGIISLFIAIVIVQGGIKFPFAVGISSFNNQCSLDACSSGYTQNSVQCIGLNCYRECAKTEKICGTYSTNAPKTLSLNVDSSFKNVWKQSPGLELSSSKCYRYKTLTSFIVTNRKPNLFQQISNSHEVYTKDNLGKTSSSVLCHYGDTIKVESGQANIGKGTGQTVYAYGKYIPYDKTYCNAGQDTKGSNGNLIVSILYDTAPLIDKTKIESKECSFECSTNRECGSNTPLGERYCNGNKIIQDYSSPKCSSYSCSFETISSEVNTCSSSQECNNAECIKTEIITQPTTSQTEVTTTTTQNNYQQDNQVKNGYKIVDNKCLYVQTDTGFNSLNECNSELEKLKSGIGESKSNINWIIVIGLAVFIFILIVLIFFVLIWRKR